MTDSPQLRLKNAIRNQGLSVNSVADKAGMDPSYLRWILRGKAKRGSYFETWQRLADAVGVNVFTLVGGA